ncbi:sensor histidine kinase [Flavobacterium lacus]|uniref:histidine kinase n=1 Tax=Flavobacterium lacus TaxID=1353778 RepID=A0A328X108_9FLAO|nr:tetratricopeptide repeat protein [Flavobacterium lacus]RAR48899.1 two-component sensor histidine kinase [Flavobacterium lacus]
MKRLKIILLISFVPFLSQAQQNKKIDSLLNVLKAPKLDTLTVYAYNELATEFIGLDNEQAVFYARKGLKVSNAIKNKAMQAWSNHLQGLSYDYSGIADSAFYYYSKSVEIKREIGDVNGEANTFLNIGVMFFYQKEYEKAESNYKKALDLFKSTNNEVRIAAAYNNLGAIYRIQKKYNQAIETYNQSYKLKDRAKDTLGMSIALNNLGIVYQYMQQFEKAEQLMLKSLDFQNRSKNNNGLISSYVSLANLKIKQKKYEAARAYLDQAIVLGKSIDMPHEKLDIYQLYTHLDSIKGDYKSAFEHLKMYHEATDMVIQSDRKKETDKLETIYKTKEKEKEIEVNKRIIESRTNAIWIISIITSLLLVLAFRLFWLRYKLNQSNKKLNVLLVQKEDLVKEIHHRVKNNLQVISSLLNMHVRKVQDPDSKKIFDDGISRIQAMSIIHQNIYSNTNLVELNPKEYIEKLIQQLYITYQIPEKKIKINSAIEDINLDIEKLMSLGLILNELLSNAFKYAFTQSHDGLIEIILRKANDNMLELIVKDDGIGIKNDIHDAENESLGMRLIQAFSIKLNGEQRFESEKGTIFTLKFKS